MHLRSRRGCGGFSVIELALALFLIALLFGSVFVPLRARVEARRIGDTESILDRARDALLGYVSAHGYFPCPADEASNGQESAGTNHLTGMCASYHGYLPAAALGLSALDENGYALDAWGTSANRIRYAVARDSIGAAANSAALTRMTGMRAAGIAALSDPALSLLHVCSSGRGVNGGVNCGAAQTLVSTAPAVIWSSGPNAPTSGISTDEAQNPNRNGGSADRLFVSHVRSDAAGNEFDDLVAWIPMPILIHRMVAAAQLP